MLKHIFRLCGAPPFSSKDEDSLYEIIKNADVQHSDNPKWQSVSEQGKVAISM